METIPNQVSDSPAHSRVESFLYAIVVLACLLTMPVIFYQWQGSSSPLLTAADWSIWAVFVVEYGALLVFAPDRKRYIVGNWMSAGVIVLSFPQLPAVMGFVRLVRLTRILRLFLVATKGLHTMKLVVSQRSFVYVLSVTALLVVVAAQLLYMLEPTPGGFADGLWWAVVTTMGYDEYSNPKTTSGRLVAVMLMLGGTALISTVAASVSAYFIGAERTEEYEDVKARLGRIERMLEKHAPSASGQSTHARSHNEGNPSSPKTSSL